MSLISAISKQTSLSKNTPAIDAAGCLSIEFSNQSTNSLDAITGQQIGYILIVGGVKELLPGTSWSISMPVGYQDDTNYTIVFKPQATTPGTDIPKGCVTQIFTK